MMKQSASIIGASRRGSEEEENSQIMFNDISRARKREKFHFKAMHRQHA